MTSPRKRDGGPLGRPGDWLLEQGKGYIYAFFLSVVVLTPLVLLDVLDAAVLVLPAALAFPAGVIGLILLLRRRR